MISWSSKKQTTVALSSCESEYTALHFAVRESIWLKRLLQNFKVSDASKAIRILCDNQSAIALSKNPQFHQRTKHIRIQYHFIRQAGEDGDVDISYVDTSNQLQYVFTLPKGDATPATNYISFDDLTERTIEHETQLKLRERTAGPANALGVKEIIGAQMSNQNHGFHCFQLLQN